MNLNEINFLLISIWILFINFIFGFENTLKSLIISEFIWITLFCFFLIIALIYNDINFLTITLFFLIFSAIEISIFLTIILIQKKIFKTINSTYNLKKNNVSPKKRFNVSFKYKY